MPERVANILPHHIQTDMGFLYHTCVQYFSGGILSVNDQTEPLQTDHLCTAESENM